MFFWSVTWFFTTASITETARNFGGFTCCPRIRSGASFWGLGCLGLPKIFWLFWYFTMSNCDVSYEYVLPLTDLTSCAGGRHSMPPPLQVDIWPLTFKVVSESRVCANFSLPRPLCSRVKPDVRDRRQTDVRLTAAVAVVFSHDFALFCFKRKTSSLIVACEMRSPPDLARWRRRFVS